MKILFMHPNMPGQYKHLARKFAEDPDNQVVFLTKPGKPDIPNVTKLEYDVKREVAPEVHRYLITFERAIYASQEVWRVCKKMKEEGFIPDVICGHLGWGDGLFLKDIFRDVPIIAFMEFFYDAYSADVEFLKKVEIPGEENYEGFSDDDNARLRIKNALHLFNLTYCDHGLCPTNFQLERHPKEFHSKISVIHDGIDTEKVFPRVAKSLSLPNNVTLVPGKDEIVTYIARNFEPYRGFPQFMRAAEIIQKRRPNCHIIIVGQDGVSYGREPKGGKTFRQMMMEEVNLDMSRFHNLGYLPYDNMVKILQASSAHIYLTVPFVLSWSMMESMAAGCLLLASDTEPVREVITDGVNGLLVDFFSPEHVADTVDRVFADPQRMQPIRDAARKTIEDHYALKDLLPLHMDLIRDVAARKNPSPTAEKIKQLNERILSELDNRVRKAEKV